MSKTAQSGSEIPSYAEVGKRVCVIGAGHNGTVSRVTKLGVVWVKVKARWGGHHKPVRSLTFRYPMDRIAPIECDGRNYAKER